MVKQNKRKKILYIITKSVWAGAGKYVYDLATNLPKDKFEAAVAAGGRGALAKKLQAKNITYFEIKNFQRDISMLKEICAFFEILALMFKTKPSIVHVSSSKAGGIAGLAIMLYKFCALRFALCALFTVHGWAFAEPRPALQIKLIKVFSKLTCLFYNKIICVSEFDRQIALKNRIAAKRKLITIHNGIKPGDCSFLSKEIARKELIKNYKLKIKNSDPWVGTIGENARNKGHKYLKEADPDNIIIQDLPQGYNYLKAFDIFILPSVKEGLPYILMEAGLARLPVIATKVGGIPEIIEDQKTGILVGPANSQELKEAIEKLINNSELKNALAFALWEKIHREFSFEKMLRATLAAYERKG
jgi:glycosyltransferase involved in cell wall biosynthesis